MAAGDNKGSKSRDGESISAYFKRIFQERPDLLKSRSNDEILQRWRDDHGEKDVPKNVHQGLSNVKSILRKKKKGRKGSRKAKAAAAANGVQESKVSRISKTHLERLEEQIDECLAFAKGLDRAELESVINHLRRARNEVVWKTGQ
jgi:hypothetical protein